jgi:hypothetical protein
VGVVGFPGREPLCVVFAIALPLAYSPVVASLGAITSV